MPAPTVRILGIDPGLRVTGFGVIEKNGASLSYIASGCVKSGDADLADRLKTILAGLREIIGEHRPQQVALEKVFVNVNPASTLALGQARGTEMVKRLLGLAGAPSADAADALACAICHAHGGQGLGAIPTRGFRVKRGRLV